MSARERLTEALMNPGLVGLDSEEADELIANYAHELAERLRNVHGSGEGDAWNWWDAADIPAACADLIDPLSAGQVRPGEETTT
ncbi:hypothetical protein [Streptomyces canus]|uniref:hypothetical protein n=1 Tax=Streptomyces canus TaxID=58343 RepID=UPI0033B1E829